MPLFLVASPIGNLSDLSERAIDTLKRCPTIAAEDTRRTGNLLSHLGIKARLVSYYDAVEKKRVPVLLERLVAGQDVALVTDAGTPCLSDPGYPLVRAAIAAGVTVIAIPGPSAITTALAASGLPADHFRFEGYVPRTDSRRYAAFQAIRRETATTIYFEVPSRLLATLRALAGLFPKRQVVVACELTKLFEQFVRGTAAEVHQVFLARESIRGEFTLLVAGELEPEEPARDVLLRYIEAMRQEGLPDRTIRNLAARLLGVSKKEVYGVLKALDAGQT